MINGRRSVVGVAVLSGVFALVCVSIALATAGDIDLTFGSAGRATIAAGPATCDSASAYDVAVQTDGKIVVVGGCSFSTHTDFAVARFNADGSPDSTFGGGDGLVVTEDVGSSNIPFGVAIQADGKIVAAGYRVSPSPSQVVVMRYKTDGTLDETFDGDLSNLLGGNGMVATRIAPGSVVSPDDRGNDVIVDGTKIVVAGASYNGTTTNFAAVRYLDNGALDATFDVDGLAIHSAVSSYDLALSIGRQPGGKYILAGYGVAPVAPTIDRFVLERLLDDGSLDPSFDGDSSNLATGNGIVVTQVAPDPTRIDHIEDVAIQPDGKIVAAGYANFEEAAGPFIPRPAVVRYLADGGLDASFGAGGKAFLDIGPSSDIVYGVATSADGKVVIAGFAEIGLEHKFAVGRLNADGTPDSTFGTAGVSIAGYAGSDEGRGLALQSDGKPLVVGSAGLSVFGVVRFLGDPPAVPPSTIVPPTIVPPPTATITSPAKSTLKRNKLRTIAGTAGPAGSVAKVEIALRKIDKKLLKKQKRCAWLSSTKAKFKRVKAKKGKCGTPQFRAANGTDRWSYKLRQSLAAGSYQLYVRVTLTDGQKHTTFTKAAGNFKSFKLR